MGSDILGIEKMVYHSVRCDKCKCLLNDYKKNITRLKINRNVAIRIAQDMGFVKTKSNEWLCPACAKKYVENHN